MVLVSRDPLASHPAPPASSDSFDHSDDIDTVVSDSMQQSPSSIGSAGDAQETPGSTAASAEERPAESQLVASQPLSAPSAGGGTESAEDGVAPVMPGGHWTSHESQAFRRWLLIGAAGMAVVLVSIGVAGFWIAQQSKLADVPKENGAKSLADAGSPSNPGDSLRPGDSTDEDPAGQPAADAPPDSDPATPESAATDAPGEEDPAGVGGEPPPTSGDEPVLPADPPLPGAGANSNREPLLPGSGAPPASPDAGANAPAGLTPNIGQVNNARIGAALDDLEKMFQGASEPDLVEQDPRDFDFELYPADHWLFAGSTPERPPTPRRLDLQRQFRLPIANLELPEMSLLELVRFGERISNVPIALDLESVALLGHSPRTRLDAASLEGNLGQVLSAAIQPLGLKLLPADYCVVITAPGAQQLVQRAWPTADVMRAADDRVKLLLWIRSLVLGSARGAAANLVLNQEQLIGELTPIEARRVEEFLLALQLARGEQPPPPPLEWVRVKAALNAKITINRSFKTPLMDVLDEIGGQLGKHFVVDWRELAPLGWTPDFEVTLLCQDESATRALALLLTPLGMDFMIGAGDTIVVSSADSVRRSTTCRMHSIADVVKLGADPATMTKALQFRLGQEHFDPPADAQQRGDDWRLDYDPVSGCILARLPQRDQVRLASMLVTLRRNIRGK